MTNPFRSTEGVKAHRFSATRLFGIVLLFLLLAAYAIWKSERFQNLIQGLSQDRLTRLFERPVSFRTVSFRVFPPAVQLADVRIGNDPRLGGAALLTAEEVSLGGGISLLGRQLRIGRIRAVRPHISLVQFPDGTWNLPPGLTPPSREGTGIKLEIGSILVQQGTLELEGRKIDLDGRLEDATAELISQPGGQSRGTLTARRATLKIAGAEPLIFGLSARFLLDPRRGITFDEVRLAGTFGEIHATGALEHLKNLNAVFSASAELSIDEAERVFHSDLGFSGTARLQARVEIPPTGGFRVSGRLVSSRVRAEPFTLEDLGATFVAEPKRLVAQIERAGYCGGKASGVFQIENLVKKSAPMTLALQAQGISLERFFADLGLKGTGLSGSIALSVGLRWGVGGLERADGGGSLKIESGPATSLVRGRFGLPTSGGGPVSIVHGRVGLESVSLRFPQSTLEIEGGGLQIGRWQPDFDFRLRSRDFSEVDRLFQNFVAASGDQPAPLGLAGTGEMSGHLAGTWKDPNATVRLAIEDSKYANVTFGSARGTVDMREGAFFLRPLRVYDGDASLSLEGMTRYRVAPGRPSFDLIVAARGYPLSRLLDYLELRYPVTGRVTGSFPIAGSPDALTGGGSVELREAVVWGQKVPLLAGNLVLAPGRFAIEGLRAEIAGGMIRGNGALSLREKTFEAQVAGDDLPLEAVNAIQEAQGDWAGKLSFQLTGSGSLDRPDLKVTASLAQATFFGHPVPDGSQPRLEATVTQGYLESSLAVPERWGAQARGDLFGKPARIEVALDVSDLRSLLLLTPVELPPGSGGSLALTGTVTLPGKPGEFASGSFTVSRARLDLSDRPGVLATSGVVKVSWNQGKLTFEPFDAAGVGTALKISGVVDLSVKPGGLNVLVSGPIDASLLDLAAPNLGLAGRLRLDLRAQGSLEDPAVSGSVRIENGRYRLAALSQILDDIEGSLKLQGSRGDLEARAKTGAGGEVYVAGSFGFHGLSLQDFRFSLQGRRIPLRYPEDLRLLVDADLVATGGASGNLIRGEVVLQRGTYSKDIEVTLADLLRRNRPSSAIAAREPWKQRTALEVRIVSSASLEVRNNLARLTGTVDLVARGTVAAPTLAGQIILDEGGRVTFRNVRYEIVSGTITFANTEGFLPILDVQARAELKGYDLVVNLVGTWPRIQASFSSEPPLPDETIVSLLLTGSGPNTRAAGDTSATFASAAGSLLGGAATGIVTRPAQRLFKLERFELDPVFFNGTFAGFTTTVGKQISPNWLVTYSQPLFESGNREPVAQVEGRISRTWVLRMRRDENGIYLIDLRRRQRF